jgi:hypothetical protein
MMMETGKLEQVCFKLFVTVTAETVSSSLNFFHRSITTSSVFDTMSLLFFYFRNIYPSSDEAKFSCLYSMRRDQTQSFKVFLVCFIAHRHQTRCLYLIQQHPKTSLQDLFHRPLTSPTTRWLYLVQQRPKTSLVFDTANLIYCLYLMQPSLRRPTVACI